MSCFKNLGYYKPDICKTFADDKKMIGSAYEKKCGNTLFMALLPSDTGYINLLDLTKFNYGSDIEVYADTLCRLLEEKYDIRRKIPDSAVPQVSPLLGIGDYSAFLGGEIYFQKDTSWSKPRLEDIDDYKKLEPLGTAEWYKKFLFICEEIIKRTYKSGIPFFRGFFSPLDLAGALRGENIYTDFYDYPDKLHNLLDYCADATIKFAGDIYALAGKYLSGTEYGMYYTDGINMSEDIACMISGETYREFCAPHTQKVIDSFGKGYMHCHSRAMYLVKEICSLKNVVHLWLATDPNQPRPIEHVKELVNDSNGVCLAIDCLSFKEIEDNFKEIKKGNFSLCLPVSGLEEGFEAAEKFNKMNSQ